MQQSAEQDKSEQATPFKLTRARRKGTVARGADLGFLAALGAFLLYLWIAGAGLGDSLAHAGRDAIVTAPSVVDGPGALIALTGHVFGAMLRPLAFLAVAIFVTVLLFELVQTGFVFSAQPLKPDFSRLNPAKGLKRLFSKRLLIETAKNVVKFVVYVGIAWLVGKRALAAASTSVGDAGALARALFDAGLRLVAWFALAALAFAAIDQIITRKDFMKNMRMSRRELRREVREREGEPRLKQKRRQLHADFASAGKSLRGVRNADVVVTNPVHYAVALRYDAASMAAPLVVSRGAHGLAQRLRRLAFRHGIVIVEDRALARALYRGSTLDAPVPESLYRDVARLYMTLREAA
ncbi:MAG TPA: EscU/YscU/HrcU family type III secretion system export apparatus switch protein [Allosphingosinicella sp.]|nr:EscU/YscU/HrcU family type III secretion system export apparatus switch protein [Allosphingosinicella sp.]